MTRVINFCAGPSAGKTTNGLLLSGYLKTLRKDVLYVSEFAMELCKDERLSELDDQLYILGEQAHRLYMAKGKYEYVVTDAPLFMQMYYVDEGLRKFRHDVAGWELAAHLKKVILNTFNMYDNTTFFVDRNDRQFRQVGRVHDEEQSKVIDGEILQLLQSYSIPYETVSSVRQAFEYLFPDADLPEF